MEKWASSIDARTKIDLAKVEKYRAISNQAPNVVSNPYVIKACMDVLEIVEDLSDAIYNKALEKFMNSD